MRFNAEDIITCIDCGRETLRRGPVQKYCARCSSRRDRERKTKWAKEHPQKPRDPEVARVRAGQRSEIGARASVENRATMMWPAEDVHVTRMIRVAVPFDRRFSKNALWSMSSKGHVYMRQEIREVRDRLIAELARAGGPWFEGKVWIDIFVEKPNARSDAINVIDLVCDAVKIAINVDDRWFCIRRLDWSVVKEEPRIIVGVGQSVTEHHRICSYCGRELTLDHFHRDKQNRLGRGRECLECRRSLRKQTKGDTP